MIRLVLGGARSGKSLYAQRLVERLAAGSGQRPLLLATAQALDEEMEQRIGRHRAERGDGWDTVETPLALASALADLPAGRIVLVDCLTLWLTNTMLAADPAAEAAATEAAISELSGAIADAGPDITFIANEVGLGIVPENALARRFRDHAGRLNQAIAARADEVVFLAAGLPLVLKAS